MDLALSRIHYPVTTLGPGKRIGIWFQGCSIRCEGCISKDTWQHNTNLINLKEIYFLLKDWIPTCDGITISGGEPFDQEEALLDLLNFLRQFPLSILVYSGYSFNALEKKLLDFSNLIDVLISEPYDYTKSQKKYLLGSYNQRMHFLTEFGKRDFEKYLDKKPDNRMDIMFDGEILWMAGIPKNNSMDKLMTESKKNGDFIKHSQAKIRHTK